MTDKKPDLESIEEFASEVEAGLRELPRAFRRAPAADPAQVYSIRIPSARVAELRLLADERDLAPSAMVREWVLERLDREVLAERLTDAARAINSLDDVRTAGGAVDTSASLVWPLGLAVTT